MFLIPNLGTIIWVSIIFLIVFFIMSKFAWKPLLKALEERETSVATALKSAEEAKTMLSQLEKEQQLIIQKSKLEKEVLIKEGMNQREAILAEAKEKARIQTEQMIEEAQKRIRLERDSALSEIRNQIATLSVEIATKVIRADMEDKQRHEKLVNELIKEIEVN